jgi:ABC-2 type transport system ATP-binding protein
MPQSAPGHLPAATGNSNGTANIIIETAGLTKRYGKQTALSGLDVAIPHGAVGLLGANGAGKTTLLRLLLGLSTPDSGSAAVLGYDTRRDPIEIRQRVGFMPESDCLPRDATAADFVGHMAEMSGLPARKARQRAADVLYHVGLDEERYRLIKGFSTGMKQRVKLAQALVHDPGLVFLDEPTNGLDPRGRDEMLELIDRIHSQLGIAVVISSHILDDIERICSFVLIVDDGRLLFARPIGERAGEEGEILVRVDSAHQDVAEQLRRRDCDVRILDGGFDGPEMAIRPLSDETYDAIRDTVADLTVGLRSLRLRASSLEDVYMSHVDVERAPRAEAVAVAKDAQ